MKLLIGVLLMGVILPMSAYAKPKKTDLCNKEPEEVISKMILMQAELPNSNFITFDGKNALNYISKLKELHVKQIQDGTNILILETEDGTAAVATYDTGTRKFCGNILILPAPLHLHAKEAATKETQ